MLVVTRTVTDFEPLGVGLVNPWASQVHSGEVAGGAGMRRRQGGTVPAFPRRSADERGGAPRADRSLARPAGLVPALARPGGPRATGRGGQRRSCAGTLAALPGGSGPGAGPRTSPA
ncbi:hypothetical protein DYH09_00305 [bacterium CPR1]|nr:hypothetical protein [bacterium CPR1]